MTDDKLQAKLDRLVAASAAQTLGLKLLADELSLLSPGASEKIAARLRDRAELHPETPESARKQLAILAAAFEHKGEL